MHPPSLFQPLDAYGRRRLIDLTRVVGVKGARLAWLSRHGFPLPRTWLCEADFFRECIDTCLPPQHDPASLLRLKEGTVFVQRVAQARARVLDSPLPEGWGDGLARFIEETEGQAPLGLVVRTSLTCDDESVASMAGLAVCEMGVRGAEPLARAIQRAYASLFSTRSLRYLALHGMQNVSVALVLQSVVAAEATGVALTASPRSPHGAPGERPDILINANFGLGFSLGGPHGNGDLVRVERNTGTTLDYRALPKTRMSVLQEGKLVRVPVPSEQVHSEVLAPALLLELARWSQTLESVEPGVAFEVEFAVQDGHIVVLQARPALGKGYPPGGGPQTLWSCSHLADTVEGPISSLSWSVLEAAFEPSMRNALRELGVRPPRSMLTQVAGRPYLNLTSLLQVVAKIPGLDPAIVRGAASKLPAPTPGAGPFSGKRGLFARLPVTATRLLAQQVRLSANVEWFAARADRSYLALRQLDLSILPDDALPTTMRDTHRLLHDAATLMLTCASAQLVSHIALKTLLSRASPDEIEHLAQALSCGVEHLESLLPVIALAHVAAIARHEPQATAVLSGATSLADLPDGPTRRALRQYLDTYGDRSIDEAELRHPRWHEEPKPLLRMLHAVVLHGRLSPEETRLSVLLEADRVLSEVERQSSILETALLRPLIARARRFAKLREQMRGWVLRVLALERALAKDIDRRLARLDPSLPPDTAFFCTSSELEQVFASHVLELGAIARMRSAEYERDVARCDPPAWFVGKPPVVLAPLGSESVLHGHPGSGGVAEGRARVWEGTLGSPPLGKNEILVTRGAPSGLAPLFLVASGWVSELGGPLSSLAILARELALPAVVGVREAASRIRTGDRVRIDGSRGIVENLDRT